MVSYESCCLVGGIYRFMINRIKEVTKNDFVQKIAETFAVRIILILIGLLTTVIITRLLGAEGRGIYAIATTITIIGVQFANLGLHASNTYYIAKDETILPKIVGNSLFISLIIGSILSILLFIFFFYFKEFSPIENNLLMFIALISIPTSLAYLLLNNILIGLQEVRIYNKIEITNKLFILFGLGIIFFLLDIEIEYFLIVILLSNLISLFFIKKRFDRLMTKLEYSFTLFKEHIRYGFKAYLAAFFSFMVIRSDILMVNYFLGSESVGYYSIASTMAEMVSICYLLL